MRGLVVFGTCFIAIAAAALVVPCNFLILSAALAGRAGVAVRVRRRCRIPVEKHRFGFRVIPKFSPLSNYAGNQSL